MLNKVFGNRLQKKRCEYGYTQQTMADALGLNKSTYYAYEHGRAEPPYKTLIKICKLLDIEDIKKFIS